MANDEPTTVPADFLALKSEGARKPTGIGMQTPKGRYSTNASPATVC